MKKMLTYIAIFALLSLLIFRAIPKTGKPFGIDEGQLAQCPVSPNCVCSEYPEDEEHFSTPVVIDSSLLLDQKTLLVMVKESLREIGGSVIQEADGYIAATFTSGLFRFVDDVEVRVDIDARLIHIRSASQLGKSDFGVNRKRVEAFKKELIVKMQNA